VDVGLQEIIDGGIHQAVTCQGGYASERLGHDHHSEMTVARRRSRVTCMQMALILDGQELRREAAFQAPSQPTFAA
jgi:hypothetical protein